LPNQGYVQSSKTKQR